MIFAKNGSYNPVALTPFNFSGSPKFSDFYGVLRISLSVEGSEKTFELGHEKMYLMSYANNKGADQPTHPRSLISAFVVHCLDSIISLDSIGEISIL